MSDELAQLRETLAALTAELADVTAAVDRLSHDDVAPAEAPSASSADAEPPADGHVSDAEGPAAVARPPAAAHPAAAVPPPMTPPAAAPGPDARTPAAPAVWPTPPGAIAPPAAPFAAQVPTAGAAIPAAQPPAWAPPPPQSAEKTASWADTAGLKLLGWVGGGVTVLGVVMLLVIAAQQGYIGPLARVILGLLLGIALVIGGYLLHRRRDHLAVTLVCTGLAVGYLTTVAAVRTAEVFLPIAGHLTSVVIVAVAVATAVRWRQPWLAAVSFAVSALLAPVVGGGFTADVYLFELVMVVGGGAALLLASMGIITWAGAAIGAGFSVFIGEISAPVTPAILWLILLIGILAWSLLLARWLLGRAPADPGPFPIRQRSTDPAQTARDYADFHAHQRLADLARADRAAVIASLGVSALLMAMALGVAEPAGERDIALGIIAAVLAVLAGATAWAVGHDERFGHPSVRMIAWVATIIFAGVSLLRLLEGDVRSVSWMVLACVILVIVAAERMIIMLLPALAAAFVSLLASGRALNPAHLFDWPSIGLIADGTLLTRGWTTVLPAGVCVVVLAAVAWWATSRVTAARVERLRDDLAARQTDGYGFGYPTQDLATAQRLRTASMGWALICCAIVACYGLLAVTMVLSYAVSPTFNGYQVGQIVVTGIVTLAAILLLWQGFRSMLLRLGGLGLAAVAVGKLLFFDTGSLDAIPRAITVIGVGVLLLVGAVVYVTSLGRAARQDSATLAGVDPVETEAQESKPANT